MGYTDKNILYNKTNYEPSVYNTDLNSDGMYAGNYANIINAKLS